MNSDYNKEKDELKITLTQEEGRDLYERINNTAEAISYGGNLCKVMDDLQYNLWLTLHPIERNNELGSNNKR